MRRFHYYHQDTGALYDGAFVVNSPHPEADAAANAPPDHLPIEGTFDHMSQKIDVTTRQPVDWQPPAPSEHHEWDVAARRWRLSAAATERQAKRAAAMAEIARLEAGMLRRCARPCSPATTSGWQRSTSASPSCARASSGSPSQPRRACRRAVGSTPRSRAARGGCSAAPR